MCGLELTFLNLVNCSKIPINIVVNALHHLIIKYEFYSIYLTSPIELAISMSQVEDV